MNHLREGWKAALDRPLRRTGQCLRFAALAAMGLGACVMVPGADPQEEPAGSGRIRTVEVRGNVVCLAEVMHDRHEVELPAAHEHLWGFKTADGKFYTLLRTRFSEAIFLDPELRKKDLLLKARLLPDSMIMEVTYLQTVRDGVVQDFYYYCDVCSINLVSPEICYCCQGPVRTVEKSLQEGSE